MTKAITTLLEAIYRFAKGGPLSGSPAYNPQKVNVIIQTLMFNLSLAAIVTFVAFLIFRKKRSWFVKTALLLTIFELFIFSRGNLISAPLNIANQKIPAAEWLSQHAGNFRFLSTSGALPYTGIGVYWTHLGAREPFSPNKLTSEELQTFDRFKRELKALAENQGMGARLFDVSGYAAGIPANYIKFWGNNTHSPNSIAISDLSDQKLDLLAVRYIVTGYPQDYVGALDGKKFKLVFESDEIRIYENTSAWPRAFLVKNSQLIPAEIKAFEPNSVTIKTNYEKEAQLVLTDTFYPGWEARVDGQQQPIEEYQEVFRSVRLPAGEHDIKFHFKPNSVKLGAIISLTTLLTVALALVWSKKSKLRSFF